MAEQRLLISTDKGLTEYRQVRHHGILIVRLRRPNRHKIHRRVMLALERFGGSGWDGRLVVMRDTAMSTFQRTE